MTLKERLEQLVRASPPGTLIPVEGLARLIDGAAEEGGDMAVEDVGHLAATRFGRKRPYTPAAIRKWIRSGLRGVRLRAYPSGSGYRVRPADFDDFVTEVRRQGAPRPQLVTEAAAGRREMDLEAEIRSGERRYAASSR